MAGPFLVLVQYDVPPESEQSFDEWHNLHILHVLRAPGYVWARRYVAVRGGARYLTLYMVDDAGAEHAVRRVLDAKAVGHPASLQERGGAAGGTAQFGLVGCNVYQQIWGSTLGKPLLAQDHVLLLVLTEGPQDHVEEWDHWYNHVHLPNVLKDPWRLMAARFRSVEGAVPSPYIQTPRYLTLWEMAGEEIAGNLYDPSIMSAPLRAEYESPERNRWAALVPKTTLFYRPISKH